MKDTKKKSGLKERMADVFFEIKEPKDEVKVDSSQTGTGPDPKSQKAG